MGEILKIENIYIYIMCNINILEKLVVNINKIYNDYETIVGTFEVKKYVSKYSCNKKEINKIFNNGLVIKNSKYKVEYECVNCQKINNIGLGRFLTKNSLYCYLCKESDLIKKEKQSHFMKHSYKEYNKVQKKNDIKSIRMRDLSVSELIKYSEECFENEDLIFKTDYFNRNISLKEFEKIKSHISKIDGVVIESESVQFIRNIKINNSKKYTPALLLKNQDILIFFRKIEFCCESCNTIFMTSRRIKERVNNNNKILCLGCCLSNKIFKIKNTVNIIGDKITYQSKPEKKIIDFCNENNIIILDGKKINYLFQDNKKTYKIDFYLPEFNIDLEIKAEHIWHKKQIENGIWSAKMEAVQKLNYKLFRKYGNLSVY